MLSNAFIFSPDDYKNYPAYSFKVIEVIEHIESLGSKKYGKLRWISLHKNTYESHTPIKIPIL